MEHPLADNTNTEIGESIGQQRLRADSLARSVVLLLGISIIQRTIGFGRGILFCRWLSPAELGLWEMAFSFLLLAAPLAVLGLPGSFGRYLEHYRQRGQLRAFLRRTTFWTTILSGATVATILCWAPHFAKLIFGKADETTATILVGISLVAVILSHFLEAIFTAMRMFRVVSVMHFTQSLLFAAMSLTLLAWWRMEAISVVIAYGTACLVSAAGAILWGRILLREIPSDHSASPHRAFWPKLMRFALWVWVANLLCNLFAVVDRYMIIHYGGMAPHEALGQIGHYHSSRVVPLLLVSVTELLGSIVLPYLSRDWEAGRQQDVSKRLNFVLKLVAFGMLAGSIAILAVAPLLFDVAFLGKYDGGLAILPMTLCYCIMHGIMVLAQNYLWCAEKAKLCTVPIGIALFANIGLNLLLLPHFGLAGAVAATTVANGTCLALVYWLCSLSGMEIDRGTLLLSIAPLAICGGLNLALVTFFVLLCALARGKLLSLDEQQQIRAFLIQGIFRSTRRSRAAASLESTQTN
ncbi:MAG: lipopolysaccharide biosynthesis protein [Pirellulales bacterium]|nr:lipopolysaccharide biosynthesis protein [Pirellulales bacterium]